MMRARTANLGVVLLLVGWVLGSPRPASTQEPGSSPSGAATAPADPDQQYSFAVEIEVVTVPVTVTDRSGEFVTDLDKNDFTILDNGAQQKIEAFELSWEPLSLAILVETSARVASLLPEVRRSGILFTQLILGEPGEAAVLTFDREIKLAQNFTDNPDKIEAALRNLAAGGDEVRLSDAIARAISLLQQRSQGRRKVVVVISEARDHGSSNSQGLVLRGAQQLGISVYTVGLSGLRSLLGRPASEGVSSPFPPGVMARPTPSNQPPTPDAQSNWGAANVNLLQLIEELVSNTRSLLGGNPLTVYAAGTGGADFSSGGKGELEKALGRIGRELRNQYLLTYRPNNLDTPGFHAIRVLVSRPTVEARTRPGYLFMRGAPKNPAAGEEPPAPSLEKARPRP